MNLRITPPLLSLLCLVPLACDSGSGASGEDSGASAADEAGDGDGDGDGDDTGDGDSEVGDAGDDGDSSPSGEASGSSQSDESGSQSDAEDGDEGQDDGSKDETSGDGGETGSEGSGDDTTEGSTGDDDDATDDGNDDDTGDTGDDPWADDYDCDWGDPSTWAQKRAPTADVPGGLAVDDTPMFIAFGWDDNGFVDGMEWILDYLDGKTNPQGSGNDCTFDGTKTRHSFYMTSKYELESQWRRAYEQGHEIANHTHTHDSETLPQNPDDQVWIDEMTTCHEYLRDVLEVPEHRLIGFRTPFLSQSDATMRAIVDMGFVYDCSIEHYRLLSAGQYVWPYTLDDGPDANSTFPGFVTGTYPGLWEMPVYDLQTDSSGSSTVTGFDYNMWAKSQMTRQQFVDTLKYSLDHRLETNRAPLLVGMHTDYYSADNADANMASSGASYTERRAAVEDFLDYALGAHPDVRIVSYAQVLQWVRSPVSLSGKRAAR